MRAVSGPDGFNLGVNQGAVAGAGIAAHLHQHVVPRWSGDANFLPVVAQTKAVPQLLDQAWELLHGAWAGPQRPATPPRATDAGAFPGRRVPADRPAGPVPQPPRGLAGPGHRGRHPGRDARCADLLPAGLVVAGDADRHLLRARRHARRSDGQAERDGVDVGRVPGLQPRPARRRRGVRRTAALLRLPATGTGVGGLHPGRADPGSADLVRACSGRESRLRGQRRDRGPRRPVADHPGRGPAGRLRRAVRAGDRRRVPRRGRADHRRPAGPLGLPSGQGCPRDLAGPGRPRCLPGRLDHGGRAASWSAAWADRPRSRRWPRGPTVAT